MKTNVQMKATADGFREHEKLAKELVEPVKRPNTISPSRTDERKRIETLDQRKEHKNEEVENSCNRMPAPRHGELSTTLYNHREEQRQERLVQASGKG